jgi:hypothetical protein
LQGEERGGRTVVHNECGLGAGYFLTKLFDRRAAFAPLSGRKVDFHIRAGGGFGQCFDGFGREWRSTEIRMDHDSRGIDNFAQTVRCRAGCDMTKLKHDLVLDGVGTIWQIIDASVSHVAQDFSNPIGNRRSTVLCA